MHIRLRSLTTAAAAALLLSAASADAATDPRGVWIDHTGRGAVEITDCDDALCGRLVWLKDAENGEACGVQILGNVRPVGSGVWDKGWIYDPEQDAKYSVELKPIGESRLRVLGYLGTKLFSETMVWQRAPADLERCSTDETTATLAPTDPGSVSVAPEATGPETAPSSPPDEAPGAGRTAEQAPSLEPAPGKAEVEPRRSKTAENAPRAKECKISMPYFTLSFPCPD